MTSPTELLAALRHGDSFFPSGGTAFSWGMEMLCGDGVLASAADVEGFITGQLRCRWATFDRPVLVGVHRAGGDLARVAEIDRLVESMTLAKEFREGSRRAGRALLAVHVKLGTARAEAYRQSLRDGGAPGHLAVVQGLVWRGVGLSEQAAAAVSAHSLTVGLLGAALRLGTIGHIESQRNLARLQGRIADLLAEPPPALETIGSYAPQADIAAMRHETRTTRLFVN